MNNTLYYGDNMEVLRQHVADESVDLIYLDPPFNSNATYNVLFAEQDGAKAASQIKAFEDTWEWNQVAAEAFERVVESGGRVSRAMQAFRTFLGHNNLLAYLSMMAPRLMELHRVLKPKGSIYLHCDPTASHYIKMLMDAVFEPSNFRNEIIWQRTSSHNDTKRWGQIHDVILFYSKAKQFTWNPVLMEHDPKYVKSFYRFTDEKGIYRLHEIIRTASMGPRPNLCYEYKGFTPEWGWRVVREKLEKSEQEGKIVWSKTGRPYIKRYLHEHPGTPIRSVITDIPPIGAQAQERLGYPTQKPEALLERIIQASSNENDVVLDPFCGCGTAISVAQRLNRKWIGIDITHLAVTLMKHRLLHAFGSRIKYDVIGEPVSIPDAEALAKSDPYQFQWWSLGLVGARPTEQKKGADKGIDGRIYFHDEAEGGKTKQVILSVKAGNVTVSHLRDLRGVIDREEAQIGVLISMKSPTKPMIKEAASAGFYSPPKGQMLSDKKYPRLQLLTVEELLAGKNIDMPPISELRTFKKAPKAKQKSTEGTSSLFEQTEADDED